MDTPMQLPPGVKVTIHDAPPPLPNEANQAIIEARRSGGRFRIAIWTETDTPGHIRFRRITGAGWKYDHNLRAVKMSIDDMLAEPLPGATDGNQARNAASDPEEVGNGDGPSRDA